MVVWGHQATANHEHILNVLQVFIVELKQCFLLFFPLQNVSFTVAKKKKIIFKDNSHAVSHFVTFKIGHCHHVSLATGSI